MQQRFTGERGEEVAKDSLVPGHPGGVCRVWLLDDGLVFIHDRDELFQRLFDAGQQALEACRAYSPQNLRTPERIVRFGQLLTDRDGKDGGDGSGERSGGGHRRAHCGADARRGGFAELDDVEEVFLALYHVKQYCLPSYDNVGSYYIDYESPGLQQINRPRTHLNYHRNLVLSLEEFGSGYDRRLQEVTYSWLATLAIIRF
jgi:hypothetical protein